MIRNVFFLTKIAIKISNRKLTRQLCKPRSIEEVAVLFLSGGSVHSFKQTYHMCPWNKPGRLVQGQHRSLLTKRFRFFQVFFTFLLIENYFTVGPGLFKFVVLVLTVL